MTRGKIKFSFGASLKNFTIESLRLKENYEEHCKEIASIFANMTSSDFGFGWLSLPYSKTDEIKKIASRLKGYDSVIQIGIGGSALGNLMLKEMFCGVYPNEKSTEFPKFYVADNPDPDKINELWSLVKDVKTALIVVSKSGNTAETMSQFLWFLDKFERENKNIQDSIVIITDENNGVLRRFVEETSCDSLVIPESVGGRYSVLSAVGLLSASILGIDIDALLLGAKEMKEKLESSFSIENNPAWFLASLCLYHDKIGRPMLVTMPYSSNMSYFSEWYAQLWGESLGKKFRGTTPVRALGAIDQHSQIQLYTQGPDDKFFIIFTVETKKTLLSIPLSKRKSLLPLSYMSGCDFGNLLNLEAFSSAASIAKAGKPVVLINIPELSPQFVGELIFFCEYLTAFVGYLMGINPFDQPGVEQGKNYTYGLLRREGYNAEEQEASQWSSLISQNEIYI
ncbi:MAG: glucose-6-phosphate isomerase [Synergistaceae bacterium]